MIVDANSISKSGSNILTGLYLGGGEAMGMARCDLLAMYMKIEGWVWCNSIES